MGGFEIEIAQLKYLFGVHFKDGSEYFQGSEDSSLLDPAKRTAYYDISKQDEQGNIICRGPEDAFPNLVWARDDVELFQLEGEGHKYVVDLRDGHFEIDGIPFFAKIPPPNSILSLVFFRRRRIHQHNQVMDGELKTVGMSQECEYHMGWQTIDGKASQTLILV